MGVRCRSSRHAPDSGDATLRSVGRLGSVIIGALTRGLLAHYTSNPSVYVVALFIVITAAAAFGDERKVLVDLGCPADAFFGVTVTADGSTVYLAGYQGVDPEGTGNDDSVLARITL